MFETLKIKHCCPLLSHCRLKVPPRDTSTNFIHFLSFSGDMSLSEAVSNISSPDYQDQDDMFDTGRECPRMELSDPSDSDSTILVSEPCHKRAKSNSSYSNEHGSDVTLNGDHNNDYRIVIQVKGPDKTNANATENVNNNNNSNSNYTQNGKENGHNSPENQGYQVKV